MIWREASIPKGYIHIIHAYGFTMVLWYKTHGFMIHLFLNKLRAMEYLIQAVIALKIWDVFKRRFKYVIEMAG